MLIPGQKKIKTNLMCSDEMIYYHDRNLNDKMNVGEFK